MDARNSLVTIKVTGLVGAEELLTSIGRVIEHPDFHPGMKSLTDMREALHTATTDEVRSVAQLLITNMSRIQGVKEAVVVGQAVTYGMLRMLQAQMEGFPFEIGIFYDIEEATRWLESGRRSLTPGNRRVGVDPRRILTRRREQG